MFVLRSDILIANLTINISVIKKVTEWVNYIEI